MLRLAAYVGMHNYGTAAPVDRPPSTGEASLYFSSTDTPEWKAHLESLPIESRHAASVKRRLSLTLLSAMRNNLCLWCWFAESMCLCDRLEQHREKLLSTKLSSVVSVTVVMHAEELMRGTNSGHIAAFILGAPIRVWGIPEDDAYLQQLPAITVEDFSTDFCGETWDPSSALSSGTVVHTVSLYPEKGAVAMEDLVQSLGSGEKIHLLLMDATWSQANALNRHVPRHIPRVVLRVSEGYDSLFKALRKRTRQTGVSTLEATTMALQQCLGGSLCQAGVSLEVSEAMTAAMKEFVDLKCIVSYRNACFTKDTHAISSIVDRRRDTVRKAMLDRNRMLRERFQLEPETRSLLLPPVLNYCYACDKMVCWYRMVEHVMGRSHKQALRQNPFCQPSEVARNTFCGPRARFAQAERIK
ncbi:hypothetical protein TRVL_06519 [Trypanosoma vivax]|nr:hypothetical protein TRVL_06519 [Trypanosoma vivax]